MNCVRSGSPDSFPLHNECKTTPYKYCNACLCGGNTKFMLPKLNGSCPLVTTKVSDTMYKVTAGNSFDTSIPIENSTITEYSSLHDPHLKSFFAKRYMKNRLTAGGYITPSDEVLCSLKEFNRYCRFLESQVTKLKQQEYDVLSKELFRDRYFKQNKIRLASSFEESQKSRLEKLIEQKKRLANKQNQLMKMKAAEADARNLSVQKVQESKELSAMKSEAEREKKKLLSTIFQHKGDGRSKQEAYVPVEEETSGPLRKEKLLMLSKKVHKDKDQQSSSTKDDQAKAIQKNTVQNKVSKQWRVEFSKRIKRWYTVTNSPFVQKNSDIQAIEGEVNGDHLSLSAKNSLIHHRSRISSKEPYRKISVVNPSKLTQCVRFNMEPEVHVFHRDADEQSDNCKRTMESMGDSHRADGGAAYLKQPIPGTSTELR